MSRRFLLILAACVAGLGLIFWTTKSPDSTPPSSGNAKPSSHIQGKGQKKVTLVEYGDFQCPACKSFYSIVKAIVAEYQDDITFQFRHFPLVSIHPNAFAASRAAEAAGQQGKFWEMYDLLYEQQDLWASTSSPVATFEGYAQQLGLDAVKFKADYSSSNVNNVINADTKAGNEVGVDSTPTFVLDGKKLDKNPADQKEFEKLIADAIAAKKQ